MFHPQQSFMIKTLCRSPKKTAASALCLQPSAKRSGFGFLLNALLHILHGMRQKPGINKVISEKITNSDGEGFVSNLGEALVPFVTSKRVYFQNGVLTGKVNFAKYGTLKYHLLLDRFWCALTEWLTPAVSQYLHSVGYHSLGEKKKKLE